MIATVRTVGELRRQGGRPYISRWRREGPRAGLSTRAATGVVIAVRLASLYRMVVTGVTGVLWIVARVVDRVVYRMVWLMRGRLGSKWYDVLLLVWGWKIRSTTTR